MIVNFTKMHVLGNDFVVIDAITQNIKLHEAYIKKIADRHIGVGCDQIIILEPPIQPLSDFYYKIYNANGKTAEQCLNGARCAAQFAFDLGLVKKSQLTADCAAGTGHLLIEEDHIVSATIEHKNPVITPLIINLMSFESAVNIYELSIGNKHAICLINHPDLTGNVRLKSFHPDLEDPIYVEIAEELAEHKDLFPNGVNVGFIKLIDENEFKLRVFERGSGETLACGSNAIAAFLVARQLKLISEQVKVVFKLGSLTINTQAKDLVSLKSRVNSVFVGKFKI